MSDAAIAFGRAVGYRSAGTAEFMVSGRDFYFLELNGRIQVEHPVTELVTGIDLVEQQIRIARGEPLVTTWHEPSGHAVEVRLYAEDPRTFLPQTGRITRLALPSGVRVDAGVEEGDEIGLRYDPMIAKLIAHGDDAEGRARAARRRRSRETEVEGVTTNLPFLRWLVAHPRVRAGQLTTAFLVENPPLSPHPAPTPAAWHDAWRLNGAAAAARSAAGPGRRSPRPRGVATESTLAAQMPGTVLRVLVSPGDAVTARQPLLVLEAMKMETPVVSPHDATVRRLLVAEGDQVAAGTELVELED